MTSTLGIKKIQYPNGTNSITIDSSGSAAITTANITTAAITTANVTNATATGTITTPSINDGPIGGRRNMIINGAMQVAQRGTSSTGVGAADDYFTLDRWYCDTNGNSAGRLTMTQTAISDLPGFQNCLKFACTTADTSIAAAERFRLEYKMEGQDAQGLAKGTSSAKSVTVSFYVKGHDSATYTVGLYEGTTGRKIAATFPVTTSWVRQTVTFPGDTTGVIPNNNTAQLMLRFYLHGGSNYTSGTLGTSWNADGNSTQISSSGNSIFESTSATFFLTGVQMEVGSQATEFEHRSFAEELRLCSRYFWRQYTNGTNVIYFRDNISAAGQNILYQYPAPPAMRINGATVTCSLTANVSVNSNTLTYHQHGAIQVYLASISGDNYLYSQDLSINAEL